MAALDVASHTDYCKGINASKAKQKCQEAINLKNKAVQDVPLLQRVENEKNYRDCSCHFHVNALESFSETQLAGKYEMSGAVIIYRISEQVNVQKLYKCSDMYIK